jgi:hypothetical protein
MASNAINYFASDILCEIVKNMVIDINGNPSVPSWASACALQSVSKNWKETMRQALLDCEHFKGDIKWTPLDPITGYDIAVSSCNLRKVSWTGGTTVSTSLFNLELHQSIVRNDKEHVMDLAGNGLLDEDIDPTGTVGFTIVRPALELKPSIILWCMIDDDDNKDSAEFLAPLMGFNTDGFLGEYHAVELDLWNATRTLSLRDVRHQMFRMPEMLHKDSATAVTKIKLSASMQTWNTWDVSGEVAELNEHRAHSVPLKVVSSAPISSADDFKVRELKQTSPCVLISSGIEDNAHDRPDGVATTHCVNTGLFGEWTGWATSMRVSPAEVMDAFPEVFAHQSTSVSKRKHASDPSTIYSINQKLIIRNMDFKKHMCTEARETNKQFVCTGAGTRRRLTWLSPISVYCGYNAPDSVCDMGNGYFRIATSELVKKMMPTGLTINGLADTTEKVRELKNFYTSLKYTETSHASSSNSTAIALYDAEDAGRRQSTRTAAGKAKAVVLDPFDDSDSESGSDYEVDGSEIEDADVIDDEEDEEDEDDEDEEEDEDMDDTEPHKDARKQRAPPQKRAPPKRAPPKRRRPPKIEKPSKKRTKARAPAVGGMGGITIEELLGGALEMPKYNAAWAAAALSDSDDD